LGYIRKLRPTLKEEFETCYLKLNKNISNLTNKKYKRKRERK
jgi:hypothetical protein